MNRVIDLIGKNIQIIGILLLSGFLATAGMMYFGVPSPARAKAAATKDDCSNCEHHAALKQQAAAGPAHADGCCPSETPAALPPAGCPASAHSEAHAAHDHAH